MYLNKIAFTFNTLYLAMQTIKTKLLILELIL